MDRAYDDLRTPLRLLPHAFDGLTSLKRAGHTLILFSARFNRANLEDPMLDPLVSSGKAPIDKVQWERSRPLHLARAREVYEFVRAYLPGIFDVIDTGMQGKPCADLFLDDRVIGGFSGWAKVARLHGKLPARMRGSHVRQARQEVHGRQHDAAGSQRPVGDASGREVHGLRKPPDHGGPGVHAPGRAPKA